MEVSEDGGKRTTKLTGVFTGTELGLLVDNPHYDERLPPRCAQRNAWCMRVWTKHR